MITIFKNVRDIKNPNFIEIEVALDRIKNGKSQQKIEAIRNSKDKKERSNLKSELPSVCFSGKFSERKDEALLEHSGFVILDFDHIEDVQSFKTELTLDEYIYSCWVSPSGDGVKALVKIPKEPENHEAYYMGILGRYPQLDSTSRNISRVCYESYDPEIYIAQDFEIWNEKGELEDSKPAPVKPSQVDNIFTDYNKVNQVLNIIRNSVDGQKHHDLLKACKLAGGFIASGCVDEFEITRLIEQEIFSKGVNNEEGTKKTIQDGISHGKGLPIQDVLSKSNKDFSFLSEDKNEDEWLNMVRTNSVPQGYGIDSSHFDNHFRLKKKTMVGVFGADNTGKTTFTIFIMVCYAKKHGLKFLLLCKENNSASVRQKIMEVYCGQWLHQVSDLKYKEALDFSKKYFDIMDNNFEINQDNFFQVLEKAVAKSNYFSIFIDPYNSIQYDSNPKSNYAFIDKIRAFQNKHDVSFIISMHISTEKARNWVYSDKESISIFDDETNSQDVAVGGQPRIPRKNFVEGGQPIANKLDDIIIVHRIPKVKELRSYTLISVDKVKEEQTGGMQSFEEPIMFRKEYGFVSFVDRTLNNPLEDESTIESVNINTMIPNTDFDTEEIFINEEEDEVPF